MPLQKTAQWSFIALVLLAATAATARLYAGSTQVSDTELNQNVVPMKASTVDHRKAVNPDVSRSNPKRPSQKLQTNIARPVVLRSLNDFFSGRWHNDKIYIKADALVSNDLKKVGKYDAQVISEEALKRQYEGKSRAPAMASVSCRMIFDKNEPLYCVAISYNGVRIKGATQIPRGGGKNYYFAVRNRKATLIKTNTEEF
jgi:hypothetical protein